MQISPLSGRVKYFKFLFLCAALQVGCRRQLPSAPPPQQTFEHDYGLAMSRSEFENRGQNGAVFTRLESGQLLKQRFENGKLQGISTCSFPYSKQIAYSELYTKGQLSRRIDYFASGMPNKERTYLPGQVEEVRTWFEDGVPSSQECFQGKQQLQGTYFSPQGIQETQVVDGEGQGILRCPKGQLLERFEVKEGYPIWKRVFFPSGDLKEFYRYSSGLLDGECRFYSEGGVPECFQTWKCGKREGMTRHFSQGEIVAEVPYRDDKKQGTERRYCRSALVETVEWKQDQLHGPNYQLDSAGAITSQLFYYRDRPVSRLIFENLVLNRS